MSTKLKECVRLIAIAEDKATEEFFAVIRFRTVKGRFRTEQFPLAALDDAKYLRKELINKGAYFASDSEDPVSSICALQMAKDRAEHWTYAKTLGWTGDKFVRANGVVGKQNQASLLKPPRVVHPAAKKMGKKGTLTGWHKHVAKPAAQSSRMVTAMCGGFGAPVLEFSDVGSFALSFIGPSKAGKSTLTVAAGSVPGFGTESALPNFRSTDAALGELPGQFNDHLLPLNEFGLLRGTHKERRQKLREFAFGAAEGHGTTYSRLSPASNSGQHEYRSILVANGEETSDELAMRAGEFRLAGECSRWIDVPAIEGGAPDIFDFAPDLDSKKRAAWFSKTCAEIRRGCRRHHGVANRHFVLNVMKRRKTV
jgi:putative DNA primase/helicase